MKKLCLLVGLLLTGSSMYAQTFCNPDGDIAIFSNYDGGILRIDVDIPTPNLEIGIVSYEDDSVIISGAYAANVTRVVYAGFYNSNNVHCTPDIDVKGVYGVDTSIVDINFVPPATLANPNGYSSIICNTSCVLNSSQGGCNTADQVEDYFFNQFGDNKLLFHKTQYGCWTGTQSLSSGGNCCALSVNVPETNVSAGFTVYPNPAKNILNVEWFDKLTNSRMQNSSAGSPTAELKIYDATGRVVYEQAIRKFGQSAIRNNFSQGIYLVRFNAGEKTYSQKVVIE
jgi:hypothetical protein